ncbi:MAG: MarR family transcriptional regulator, partial [Pseudomonadota bacterium]
FMLTRDWRHVLDRRLAPHGLSEATWRAMLHLELLNGSAVQSLLAANMGIEGPSLVRLIDRMERDGWVRRRAHPQDRRVNVIEPTPKGRVVTKQVADAAADMRAAVFAELNTAELQQLHQSLERIEAKLRQLEAADASAARPRPVRARSRAALAKV